MDLGPSPGSASVSLGDISRPLPCQLQCPQIGKVAAPLKPALLTPSPFPSPLLPKSCDYHLSSQFPGRGLPCWLWEPGMGEVMHESLRHIIAVPQIPPPAHWPSPLWLLWKNSWSGSYLREAGPWPRRGPLPPGWLGFGSCFCGPCRGAQVV